VPSSGVSRKSSDSESDSSRSVQRSTNGRSFIDTESLKSSSQSSSSHSDTSEITDSDNISDYCGQSKQDSESAGDIKIDLSSKGDDKDSYLDDNLEWAQFLAAELDQENDILIMDHEKEISPVTDADSGLQEDLSKKITFYSSIRAFRRKMSLQTKRSETKTSLLEPSITSVDEVQEPTERLNDEVKSRPQIIVDDVSSCEDTNMKPTDNLSEDKTFEDSIPSSLSPPLLSKMNSSTTDHAMSRDPPLPSPSKPDPQPKGMSKAE